MQESSKNKIILTVIFVLLIAVVFVFYLIFSYKAENKEVQVPIIEKENTITKEPSPEEMDGKISDEDILKEEYKLIDEKFLIAKGVISNINEEYFDLDVKYKEGECDFIFKDKNAVSFKVKDNVLIRKLEGVTEKRNNYIDMNIKSISIGDEVQIYFEKDYSKGLIAVGIKVLGENLE